jgi:pimeloyl-ACP methyl ester carboxylesterase
MIEHRIEVEGGTVFAVECGEGRPLAMLHGWPLDHRMFDYQVDALAKQFRCIAIDRRGFGRSTAPPDMRREPDDIDRILDALGIETTHLLGVSQGGRVALRYAATRPERLRSLLLQGAVVDGLDIAEPEAERVPVARYAEMAAAGHLDDVIADWLAHPMMSLPTGHDAEQRLLREIVGDYRGADLVHFEPAHYTFEIDVLEALATRSPPILILTGAHETLARKRHAQAICERAAECREIVFADSGHLSNLTEPHHFNRVVAEFLSTLDRRAA